MVVGEGRRHSPLPSRASALILLKVASRSAPAGTSRLRTGSQRRVIGRRFALRQPQKAMQRQGIGAPPGDLSLGIQTFELADEQHAEVAAWRDRRAANTILVVRLAQHLSSNSASARTSLHQS